MTPTTALSTLDHQITLIALGAKGTFFDVYKVKGTLWDSYKVQPVVAGAVLVELALSGRIEVVDGKVTVRDRRPVGVTSVDHALHSLAARGRPSSVKWALNTLKKKAFTSSLDALTAAGLLKHERSVVRSAIAAPPKYTPVDDEAEAAEDDLRARLAATLTDEQPRDPRMAALAVIADAGGLHKRAFPDLAPKAAKERAEGLAGAEWAPAEHREAVRAVLAELPGAIRTATAASTLGA